VNCAASAICIPSPEFPFIVSYVETIAELPWDKLTEDNLRSHRAQEILDRDHFDLEKVKRRLIEYLACANSTRQVTAQFFASSARGVGKTSLGRSSPMPSGGSRSV